MLRILFGTQVDLAIYLLTTVLVGLSGCGLTINNPALSSGSSGTPTGTPASTPIQLHAGGQEWSVNGANIQLYAAGTQGMASSATPLLTQPVATDSSGNLTITEAYACPSPTSQVYFVARGGNLGQKTRQMKSPMYRKRWGAISLRLALETNPTPTH